MESGQTIAVSASTASPSDKPRLGHSYVLLAYSIQMDVPLSYAHHVRTPPSFLLITYLMT